jgi:hypothetical protein
LRDCSLLTLAEEGRYRLLETLREYAWEQLKASGEQAEIQERHRDWYLHLAEQSDTAASGPERTVSLARLATEIDNLRAALAWCQEAADAAPESECGRPGSHAGRSARCASSRRGNPGPGPGRIIGQTAEALLLTEERETGDGKSVLGLAVAVLPPRLRARDRISPARGTAPRSEGGEVT